jgi:signal recognition particle subunit SEC65
MSIEQEIAKELTLKAMELTKPKDWAKSSGFLSIEGYSKEIAKFYKTVCQAIKETSES